MPYKFETSGKIIPDGLKRSQRLTIEQKSEIQRSYLAGEYSMRALAKIYDVSRRTIQFAVYPQRRLDNYAVRVANGGSSKYYDRENHNESMRDHRFYKKLLDEAGRLQ